MTAMTVAATEMYAQNTQNKYTTHYLKKNLQCGTGEMSQQVAALAAFPKDSGSPPRTHKGAAQNHL